MVAGLAVVLLGVGALGALWVRMDREDMGLPGSADGGTTYLFVGSDRRVPLPGADRSKFGTPQDVPGARADVVVLVRVDDAGDATVLAVPRDLVVLREGRGPERLALTLENGGGAVADALCNSLGIGVDHVAVIEFDGLRSLVDLAGGVVVDAEVAMRDPNSGLELEPGENQLDGLDALAYVRARSIESSLGGPWAPDPLRSAQRPQRAVDVLGQVATGLDVSWTSPVTAYRTGWTAAGAVTVDGSVGPLDLLAMRDAAAAAADAQIVTFPVVMRPGTLPIADPAPGAVAMVDTFQGPDGGGSSCSEPALLAPPS